MIFVHKLLQAVYIAAPYKNIMINIAAVSTVAVSTVTMTSWLCPRDTPVFCSDSQMRYPPNQQTPKHRIVHTLIGSGNANVHTNYDEALRLAVSDGDAPMVELLAKKYGADPGAMSHLAVRNAVRSGNVDVAEVLLELYDASGYLKQRTPLTFWQKLRYFNDLPYDKRRESNVFENQPYGSEILGEAAASGSPAMVDLLIDKYGVGRDNPERLSRALKYAAQFGKLDTAVHLARILTKQHGTNAAIAEAVCEAAAFGHARVVDVLCTDWGADALANGDDALHRAANMKNDDVVDLLCGKYKVNGGAHDNIAVRLYAEFGDAEMVDKLVREYGASGRDEYALELAAYQGHLHVVRLLMEHGARPQSGEDDPLLYAQNVARDVLPKVNLHIDMPPIVFGDLPGMRRHRDRLMDVLRQVPVDIQ